MNMWPENSVQSKSYLLKHAMPSNITGQYRVCNANAIISFFHTPIETYVE